MKSETLERDMHMEVLIWRTTLQEAEELLDCIDNKLHQAKLAFEATDTNTIIERLTQRAKKFLEKTKQLKQRISKFENKLSLLKECDTSQCDTAFFEEAEAIAVKTNNSIKNLKVFALELKYYLDAKIPD